MAGGSWPSAGASPDGLSFDGAWPLSDGISFDGAWPLSDGASFDGAWLLSDEASPDGAWLLSDRASPPAKVYVVSSVTVISAVSSERVIFLDSSSYWPTVMVKPVSLTAVTWPYIVSLAYDLVAVAPQPSKEPAIIVAVIIKAATFFCIFFSSVSCSVCRQDLLNHAHVCIKVCIM